MAAVASIRRAIKSAVTQAGSGVCTLAIAFSSLLYLVWVVFRR